MKKSEKEILLAVCHTLLDLAIIAQNSRIQFPDSQQSVHFKQLFDLLICCERKLRNLIPS